MPGLDGDIRGADNKLYHTEYDAKMAEVENRQKAFGPNASSNAGGGLMGGMSNIFLMICIIGPVIASFLLGLIWGLLFKLKIVGRVLQTFIFGTILWGVFFTIAAQNSWGISYYLQAVVAGGIGLIYYFLIYPIWEKLDTLEFAGLIRGVFCFMWFGGIAGWIIGFFRNSEQTSSVIFGLSVIGAIVFYIIKTIPYVKEAWEDKADQLRPHVLIVSIFAVALPCTFPTMIEIVYELEIKEAIATFTVGKEISTTKRYGATLYEEPVHWTELVKLKEIPPSTALTVIGEPVRAAEERSVYIPVEYEGVKGYVRSSGLITMEQYDDYIKGTATVLYPGLTYPTYNSDSTWKEDIPIPVGATVNVIKYLKKDKWNMYDRYWVEYNGQEIGAPVEMLEVPQDVKNKLGVR